MSNYGYTDAQAEALAKAFEMLSEHFDSAIVAISAEVPDVNGELVEQSRIYWAGGYTHAVGLAQISAHHIMTSHPNVELKP